MRAPSLGRGAHKRYNKSGGGSGWVGLSDAVSGNGQKNVASWSPFLDAAVRDPDPGGPAVESLQSRLGRANVVEGVSGRPYKAIDKVQADGNIYVNPGIKSGTWQVHHDGDDESEECDDVL